MPATQISLDNAINTSRKLVFIFGYANMVNAATPIEIPTELFKSGYAATYSFSGSSQRTCWGQAAYVDDTTISLVGTENGYTPYLLAVYGIS